MASVMSMTGRGLGRASDSAGSVEVEISSVNRKQLDVVCALPREWTSLEPDVLPVVREALSRGRVYCDFRFSPAPGAADSFTVDVTAARGFVSALRDAAARLGLRDDLSASLLLQWPDVVRRARNPGADECLRRCALRALSKALASLKAMRRREGAALAADLRARFAVLRRLSTDIDRRAPAVAKRYAAALRERVKEVCPEDDERLLREIALFADRSDITEERVRIASHLDQAAALLRDGGPVGRKLDFLVQELGREINTIGSKANDEKLSSLVIDFKAELERIREQVQNLE